MSFMIVNENKMIENRTWENMDENISVKIIIKENIYLHV